MSRNELPTVVVGNDFVVLRPRLQPAVSMVAVAPAEPTPFEPPVFDAAKAAEPEETPDPPESAEEPTEPPQKPEKPPEAPIPAPTENSPNHPHTSVFKKFENFLHRFSLGVFALLFLLVGLAGITVGGTYLANNTVSKIEAKRPPKAVAPTIAGLNISVSNDKLEETLQKITHQPTSITVGTQPVEIDPETIRDWLQVKTEKGAKQSTISIKANAINSALNAIVAEYVKAPVNQVTTTYADGTSAVIAKGKDGTKLSDQANLQQQADAIAKTVMDAKGMQFNAPLDVQPFASVTPAAFPKLIEVNVVTKQMYLYENGSLFRTYPISAGAPETPTPIGQYKIYAKFTVQDMRGSNPNGTPYFQPKVKWINYFLPGGYAVHGNYWRPTSWFGVINSSHGCVSLPDSQAQEVYNWAPIGTSVITHY